MASNSSNCYQNAVLCITKYIQVKGHRKVSYIYILPYPSQARADQLKILSGSPLQRDLLAVRGRRSVGVDAELEVSVVVARVREVGAAACFFVPMLVSKTWALHVYIYNDKKVGIIVSVKTYQSRSEPGCPSWHPRCWYHTLLSR